jgi:transcriptional regulator with XRE-family HTH domain
MTTTRTWWRGTRLARARRRRALTQVALARLINGHQMTVSRLERGVSRPSIRMLLRLAKALGVPLTDLLPR